MSAEVHLVRGDDPVLRDDLVEEVVRGLLGDDDRTLALEDVSIPSRRRAGEGSDDEEPPDGAAGEQPVFRRVMTALCSPPFMTARRVVVVRDVGGLAGDQLDELVEYLGAPVDTSALVLVTGGGRLSTRLTKAVKQAGGEEHVPAAEQRTRKRGEPSAVARQLTLSLADAGLELMPDARHLVEERLGDDAGRVPELVALLASTFGGGTPLDVAAVAPYVGELGTVARYELANAIDAGDGPRALEVLERMMHATSGRQARGLHPLQIMATLHFHYRDLLRLDDPAIATKEQAAEAIGGSPWSARHRLEAARALGSDGLREAFRLLARADLDLRGATGVPPETVTEVLVARLARLARRRAPAGAGRGRG